MKIITVCGLGCGTSLMLKMTIQDILTENQISAEIDALDLGSVKGRTADLFVASEDMRSNFRDLAGEIVFIKNLIDVEEIREKVLEAIKSI